MKTPATFRTLEELCDMTRDNASFGKNAWAIMQAHGRDFEMVIVNLVVGHEATGEVRLTRKQFEQLAEWYFTGRLGRKQTGRYNVRGGSRGVKR